MQAQTEQRLAQERLAEQRQAEQRLADVRLAEQRLADQRWTGQELIRRKLVATKEAQAARQNKHSSKGKKKKQYSSKIAIPYVLKLHLLNTGPL